MSYSLNYLVSPLITPVLLLYTISYITPPLRNLDYSSHDLSILLTSVYYRTRNKWLPQLGKLPCTSPLKGLLYRDLTFVAHPLSGLMANGHWQTDECAVVFLIIILGPRSGPLSWETTTYGFLFMKCDRTPSRDPCAGSDGCSHTQ